MPANTLGPVNMVGQSMSLPAKAQGMYEGGMKMQSQGMDGRKNPAAAQIAYLIVGGGAGGNSSSPNNGGGGGAVKQGAVAPQIGAYAIVVAPSVSGGFDGTASSAFGVTAPGGKLDGSSGSGGGAGGAPTGGVGTLSSISGTLVSYAAGGGGYPSGLAGDSSGGDGAPSQFVGGGSAPANRGGGGGGGDLGGGGSGGSGVVIIRYPTGAFVCTGGTITQSGGFTIHTFTSNGTFTRTK